MSDQVRTFRCPDELWEAACERAGDYGISVSHAIRLLLGRLADGRGIGVISRPEVTADVLRRANRAAGKRHAEALRAAGVITELLARLDDA